MLIIWITVAVSSKMQRWVEWECGVVHGDLTPTHKRQNVNETEWLFRLCDALSVPWLAYWKMFPRHSLSIEELVIHPYVDLRDPNTHNKLPDVDSNYARRCHLLMRKFIFLANAQYLSTHIQAWPSISYLQAGISAIEDFISSDLFRESPLSSSTFWTTRFGAEPLVYQPLLFIACIPGDHVNVFKEVTQDRQSYPNCLVFVAEESWCIYQDNSCGQIVTTWELR